MDAALRATFLMEQHIGHRTFYQNLRRFASVDPRIQAQWVEVSYHQPDGALERSRLVPARLKGTLRGIQQTRSGLAASPAKVAFFNTQVPSVFVLDRLKALPCVVCTDITPLQYDGLAQAYGHQPDTNRLLKAFKHSANRAVFQRAAAVVGWSSWVRDSLLSDYGVPQEKIHVIPPGIDLETWSPDPAYQSDQERARILFVGGDFTRKGGPTLLEAFRRLDPAAAELHVVTREEVPPTPGVTVYHGMTPNSPELIRLYRRCDLFALPTQAEAFGIAAIEALACGLPVIASHVGGLADVVEDGFNGRLVAPGDSQALAQALQEFTKARAAWPEMRLRARTAAEQRFDARKNAARIVSLLLACAGRQIG